MEKGCKTQWAKYLLVYCRTGSNQIELLVRDASTNEGNKGLLVGKDEETL